ncbi:MAG: bifunctional YncE family protein/alkaline phosphatase family protein [Isosphaerales bacterium]
MTRRNVGIALLLALASFIGTVDRRATAQDKPPAATTAQPPRAKSAEHATEGEEGSHAATKALAREQGVVWPGMTRAGRVVLPNGWSLKPAGRQSRLGDLPVQIAVHPKEPVLAILHAGYGEHEVMTVNASTGRVIGRVTVPASFSGLVWSAGGERLFAGGGFDDRIYRFDHAAGLLSKKTVFEYPDRNAFLAEPNPQHGEGTTRYQRVPAGLALSSDGKTLYVAAAFGHSLGRFDAESGAFQGEIRLEAGSYPYGLALDESRKQLYVSLWSKAKVAVVNTQTFQVAGQWTTEEHPNEMLLARGGKILFVANANRNTVTVIDTQAGKPIATIGTAIDPGAPPGSTPNSLALSPDESMLFVANANTNDLAVVNVKDPGASAPLGFIPVGWYPTSVRLAADGKMIYVANGKGASSRANRDGPRPGFAGGRNPIQEYIGGLFQGTLSIIPMPAPRQMAAYSQTVYECSPLRPGDPTAAQGPAPAPGHPIPFRLGDPSPIRYVVYIVKENRTYDQVLGDIREGNGEPNLCLFPEAITPNHHALARDFVLLDNFYVESEVSADGHEWSMGAYATDFVERIWPLGYRGDRRVPYPAEGAFDEVARPAGGYLWDKAAAKGISFRSFGEFIANGRTPADPGRASVKALEGHFDPLFRSFDMDYPDAQRADRFLAELAGFEKAGDMPQLVILRLPNDHTSGTSPGKWTVTACVGDNDLALGRLVEGLSKSRFWRQMAIFVVEDDAQNGSDHVDAHRTVALAISPYIKRHSVDSTMYSTSSMLRTMELILGLEPMSQFDAAARPMFRSFTSGPDFTPYIHRPARVDLNARNTRSEPMADVSRRLNLEIEDRADDLVFNEIIWKAVKGADAVMPPPVRAAFVLPRR